MKLSKFEEEKKNCRKLLCLKTVEVDKFLMK